MKILLIGKNGQIGQTLQEEALSRQVNITAFSREELDVTNPTLLERVITNIQPDIVINTSAYHLVSSCEENPQNAFAVNTIAVKNLSIICNKIQTTFVTYSTDYVFNGKKGTPYEEYDTPHPLQIYGISKLAGEYAALSYHTKSIVIRTCGVYGGKTGSKSKMGNFVLTILKQIEGKTQLEVSSDQIVSPTYANDIAKSTLDLLNNNPTTGIYHLVNEGYCSWAEFAQEIINQKGESTKIIPVDRSKEIQLLQRPQFSALENREAKQYGVALPHWKDALRRYIAFL